MIVMCFIMIVAAAGCFVMQVVEGKKVAARVIKDKEIAIGNYAAIFKNELQAPLYIQRGQTRYYASS